MDAFFWIDRDPRQNPAAIYSAKTPTNYIVSTTLCISSVEITQKICPVRIDGIEPPPLRFHHALLVIALMKGPFNYVIGSWETLCFILSSLLVYAYMSIWDTCVILSKSAAFIVSAFPSRFRHLTYHPYTTSPEFINYLALAPTKHPLPSANMEIVRTAQFPSISTKLGLKLLFITSYSQKLPSLSCHGLQIKFGASYVSNTHSSSLWKPLQAS